MTPDDRTIVTGSEDKTIRLWDAATGQQTRGMQGHADFVRSVDVSHNGALLVSGSDDNTVRVWRMADGVCLHVLRGHTVRVLCVRMLPDGKKAVSASCDGTLRVWDVVGGREVSVLRGHTGAVTSVHITRDGRKYISGSGDKTARVWNAAAPNAGALKVLQHDDIVRSVCTARGDTIIVTGCYDSTVWLWEMATGARMKTFAIHTGWVTGICATPDGKRIASCSDDGSVRFTDIDDDTGRALVHAMPTRTATTSVGAAFGKLRVEKPQLARSAVMMLNVARHDGTAVRLRMRRGQSEYLSRGGNSFTAAKSGGEISRRSDAKAQRMVRSVRE